MKRKLTASISTEGDWVIAQCLEVDVASQGATEEEARANLREALELHFGGSLLNEATKYADRMPKKFERQARGN